MRARSSVSCGVAPCWNSGSCGAMISFVQRNSSSQSRRGTPSISAITAIVIRADTSRTKSPSVFSAASSSTSRVTRATLSSMRADGARREPAAGHAAVAGVVGRVHVEQVARRALRRRRQVVGEHGEARRVQEELRLLADLDDVGVLGDRPERIDVRPLVPEHRVVPAQPRPLGVRVAVALVVLGGGDVERRGVEVALGSVHHRVSPRRAWYG